MSELKKIAAQMDSLLKSIEDLEKMNPIAAGALRGAAVGAVTGGIKGAVGAKGKMKKDDPPGSSTATQGTTNVNQGAAASIASSFSQMMGSHGVHKAEEKMEKPPVSEAQRRAMHAAASGKSTLGIPASVGKDFADADKSGKLPEKKKKDKTEKADGSAPDKATQGFLESFTPATKHPKEPTAGMPSGKQKGARTTSTGFKLQVAKTEEQLDSLLKSIESLAKRDDNTNGKQHFEDRGAAGQGDLQHGDDPEADNQNNAPGDAKQRKKKTDTLNADVGSKLEEAIKADNPDDGRGTVLDETVKDRAKKAVTDPSSPYYRAKPDESNAPTIRYGAPGSNPVRTSGGSGTEGAVPKEKLSPLKNPAFRTKLAEQRRAAGVKKHYEDIVGDEDLLSKAEKDELFSEKPWKMAAPEYHSDKECAANEVYYQVMRLQEIRDKSFSVESKHPEAKAAFEYLYDCEKKKLKEKVECYKTARPRKEAKLSKSELLQRLDSKTLTASLRKSHSDAEIGLMIKAAVDAGRVHRNVLLEWYNFQTVNPAVLDVYDSEE